MNRIINEVSNSKLLTCLMALSFASGLNAQTTTTFSGGNLGTPGNWSNGFSSPTNSAIINTAGTLTSVTQNDSTLGNGTITVGGGTILTFQRDIPIGDPLGTSFATWIVNDATLDVTDDIFTSSGIFTLNSGSSALVDDALRANNAGTLVINGGTHSALRFGNQQTGTLEFLGGFVDAGTFGLTAATASATIGGGATLEADAFDFTGKANFLSSWSGSLNVATLVGSAAWEAEITEGWTLDGVAIDSASFASNFGVTGTTLSLIPEPSMFAVILGSLGLIVAVTRRRRG